MKYGSVCSGIEASTVAWHPLGWEPLWFSEIDPFPNAVLAKHYPLVPNLGDMTEILNNETFLSSNISLLVGGTPCQSFSSAGSGGGLDDPRGNLALHFLRIAKVKRPKWIVWENVTGVLSSHKGQDFATFLEELRKCGYGGAYRVLDAQGFGVPQHRERVILVAHSGGDWRPPTAVLFESKDVPWRDKEGDKAWKRPVPSVVTESELPVGVDIYNYAFYGLCAASTLGANSFLKTTHGPRVADHKGIRIHTPRECELLQGLPEGYTDIEFPACSENKMDQLRIKAIGNAMAVPMMRWVGERIIKFETLDVGL